MRSSHLILGPLMAQTAPRTEMAPIGNGDTFPVSLIRTSRHGLTSSLESCAKKDRDTCESWAKMYATVILDYILL